MIERSNSTPRRATQITALVAAALFMENLDSTIIVTALPQMARSFGTDPVALNIGITTLDALALSPDAGSLVSGHPQSASGRAAAGSARSGNNSVAAARPSKAPSSVSHARAPRMEIACSPVAARVTMSVKA
jgi:hypothetical protein